MSTCIVFYWITWNVPPNNNRSFERLICFQCACPRSIGGLARGSSSPTLKSWRWWRSSKWKGHPTGSLRRCPCFWGHRLVTTNPTRIRIRTRRRGLRPHKSAWHCTSKCDNTRVGCTQPIYSIVMVKKKTKPEQSDSATHTFFQFGEYSCIV